ncbi:hypothetical protein JOB18_029941 [Solea senegalensis]|uniref:Uncharacterized protein n=1 Tax=Solea senegalensis TaxID=28829 RepID=A0AAV6PY62_SOLSE|nr:hypothetical protein JOB18_029941 [Solea senegalensis]
MREGGTDGRIVSFWISLRCFNQRNLRPPALRCFHSTLKHAASPLCAAVRDDCDAAMHVPWRILTLTFTW